MAKHAGGRPKKSQTREIISLRLPREQVEYLKSTGNITGTIQRLVEEKMATKLTYKVIEDNGGGLALFVFDGDTCIWTHAGYEQADGQLVVDVANLDAGEDPRVSWENSDDEPQAAYVAITSYENGWQAVAEGPALQLHPERFGAAASREFRDTLNKRAGDRINADDELREYAPEFLEYDWYDATGHYAWLVSAPKAELLTWAQGIRKDEEENLDSEELQHEAEDSEE